MRHPALLKQNSLRSGRFRVVSEHRKTARKMGRAKEGEGGGEGSKSCFFFVLSSLPGPSFIFLDLVPFFLRTNLKIPSLGLSLL